MNKTELIAAVAKAAELKKVDAEKAVRRNRSHQTALKAGDKVS